MLGIRAKRGNLPDQKIHAPISANLPYSCNPLGCCNSLRPARDVSIWANFGLRALKTTCWWKKRQATLRFVKKATVTSLETVYCFPVNSLSLKSNGKPNARASIPICPQCHMLCLMFQERASSLFLATGCGTGRGNSGSVSSSSRN